MFHAKAGIIEIGLQAQAIDTLVIHIYLIAW